eukprot:m.381974 g.381974  ORF g.381974 m.381974 type:complete len:528 (-) comp28253_c0_seq2:4124-5707(-)
MSTPDGSAGAAAAEEPIAFPADPAGYTLKKLIASPRDGVEFWTATTVTGEESVIIKKIASDLLFADDGAAESYDRVVHALHLASMLQNIGVWRHHSAFMTEAELWVVCPRYEGTLNDILVRLGRPRFSELTIAHIAKKVLQSLEYMHSSGCVHRSVSSHAIAVSRDGSVQLCRLHNAFHRPAPTVTVGAACHDFACDEQQIPWAAPDLLRQDLTGYTEKVDVYSVGILVLELLLGRHPYYGMLSTEILLLKLQDERGPLGLVQSYLQLSRSCMAFLRECLNEDDFGRPSAKQLLTMQFIRQSRRVPQELVAALATLPTFEDDAFECPLREIVEVESRYDELNERWAMDVTGHAFPAMHSTGLRYIPQQGRPADAWTVGDIHDGGGDGAESPAPDPTNDAADGQGEAADDQPHWVPIVEEDADESQRRSSIETVVSDLPLDADPHGDIGGDEATAPATADALSGETGAGTTAKLANDGAAASQKAEATASDLGDSLEMPAPALSGSLVEDHEPSLVHNAPTASSGSDG